MFVLWESTAAKRRHVVRWFGARDTLQAARQHMAGRYASEQCLSRDHLLLVDVPFWLKDLLSWLHVPTFFQETLTHHN
jgi:hypothetical protein